MPGRSRSRARRRVERRSQLAILSRLPRWAVDLLDQVTIRVRGSTPALRDALEALRGVVRLLEIALEDAEAQEAPAPPP